MYRTQLNFLHYVKIETVVRNMIHRPCGHRHTILEYEGQQMYEKIHRIFTGSLKNHNGFPKYRMRDSKIFVIKRVHKVDNRDVLP